MLDKTKRDNRVKVLRGQLQKMAVQYRAFTNSSSFVGNMRYDQDEQSMTGILSGKHYKWCGVPESKFDSFQGAGSAGAFFNRDIKGQYDCSSMGKLNQVKSRISQLQKMAGLQKIAYAGIHSAKPVMDAFKNKKPLRFGEKPKGKKTEYAFQTDGKILYQSGYPIAEHTKNGIKFSYQGHPTATTSDTARYLGIDTFTKKGVTYINGEVVDPYGFDYVEVPWSNISDTPVKVNPKSKPIINEQTKQKNRDQEAFRIKAEKEAVEGNQDLVVQTKTKKEPLDHGSITKAEQKGIKKITGLGKDVNETFATAYDHSLPAEKGGGIGGGVINRRMTGGAVPLSRKTHFEKHFPEKTIPESFYKKISQLQGKLQKIAAVGLPDNFGKDPEEFSNFSDFLDKFQKGENPDLKPSKYPLPKYFEEDYEAFHDKVQDSAFRFEDASDAGIDIENKENENQLQGNWGDLSETNKGSLRNHYQKQLSKELSWQKDPKLYTSGKLPESQQTYAQPGFHKNLIPDDVDPEGGYATINPNDIKPKFPKQYDDPSKYSKLKGRLQKIATDINRSPMNNNMEEIGSYDWNTGKKLNIEQIHALGNGSDVFAVAVTKNLNKNSDFRVPEEYINKDFGVKKIGLVKGIYENEEGLIEHDRTYLFHGSDDEVQRQLNLHNDINKGVTQEEAGRIYKDKDGIVQYENIPNKQFKKNQVILQ